jgi:hypothetical protein
MRTWYYELSDLAQGYEHKYYTIRNDRASDAPEAGGFNLTSSSNRIWLEEDGRVKWIKNRWAAIADTVDLKEFMWVKLQSHQIG